MAPRVLIVDDQKDVSRLLRSALETIEQGLSVAEAPSGEEAMLELSKGKIDLLVSDYRLPGMNGLELTEKIRARNPDVRVILVTGVTDPKAQAALKEAKVDAYFTKPVPVGDFLAAVETALGLARTVLTEAEKTEKVEEERRTLGDILADLRKSLDAQAILLINADAQVEAEAGQPANQEEIASFLPTFVNIHSASQRISGSLTNHIHLFANQESDLVLIPVTNSHSLLLIGRGQADTPNLPKTLKALQAATAELVEGMQKIGFAPAAEPVANQPAASVVEEETADESVDEFADLLFGATANKKQDAASFWDGLVEKGTTYNEPDKLTFEQAAKLGLTPDDKNG